MPQSPSSLPDLADLESDATESVVESVFGNGWPDRGQFSLQEPEVEEEANGWEVVNIKSSRSSSFSESHDKGKNEEDLMVGCLDPSCEKIFGPGEQRLRCSLCGFFFCHRHLRKWPVIFSSDCPGNSFLDSLNLPKSNPVLLCSECRFELLPERLELTQLMEEILQLKKLPLAALKQKDDALIEYSATSSALDVFRERREDCAVYNRHGQLLALEASEVDSENFPLSVRWKVRASARQLLLRLLDQLRRSLRPWTDAERDWVFGLARELVEQDICWLAQIFRQTHWDRIREAKSCAELLERVHRDNKLPGREALQLLSTLGRNAFSAASVLGERPLGLLAVHAAHSIKAMGAAEVACCLELLLDAAHELGSAGATGGCRAILGPLLALAKEDAAPNRALCNEYFWALEARAEAMAQQRRETTTYADTWPSVALQELLKALPQDIELGLLRQHSWVRHLERGDYDCCKFEPAWGEERMFPLAVWPPYRSCLGLEFKPRKAESKSAPVIARCCFHDSTISETARVTSSAMRPSSREVALRRKSSGLLLKKDVGMHKEQQVGNTLRLLELYIWQDKELQKLLQDECLAFEDVRATYTIVMTGPGTAMLEFIDGARTLREVRTGTGLDRSVLGTVLLFSPGEKGTLLTFLRAHNGKPDLAKALARLSFTAAVSAVLSFVAGLGDRHHENFMVTVDGRLVHVDFGYALGREPLDSLLIHFAVQGGRPATTIQYDELFEALGSDLLDRIFWPVVRKAFLRVRQHPGLLAEMFYTALLKDRPKAKEKFWRDAQGFVARSCVTAMPTASAERFIHSLLLQCTRQERGAQLRDELKGLRLGEKTSEAVSKAWQKAGSGTRAAAGLAAEVVSGPAMHQVRSAAQHVAFDLMEGVRGLFETSRGVG
ncbi:unnamed protein product [Effrenium voratum]|uniref:PI3K/PI4K catalytic domain-containing protein n=1 Tax=Effrenium voratum TaxID=2562239 RepID=A0AA36NG69_9DINO|nr:unnamed protein product [Effrenium voratum]CAJ1424667.1 unnamed protein product [Effrenium voratum]